MPCSDCWCLNNDINYGYWWPGAKSTRPPVTTVLHSNICRNRFRKQVAKLKKKNNHNHLWPVLVTGNCTFTNKSFVFQLKLHLDVFEHIINGYSSLVPVMAWCPVDMELSPGPVFCVLLGVNSDYAQPITGQVTEVTCPVIGRAQPELTPSKRQKTGPDQVMTQVCDCQPFDFTTPQWV